MSVWVGASMPADKSCRKCAGSRILCRTPYISGYSHFEESDFAGKTVELNVNDIRKNAYMYRFLYGDKIDGNRTGYFLVQFYGAQRKIHVRRAKDSMFSIRTIRRENIR